MASFKIILYTQKTYSNGKHPVMGVISHKSRVFRFTIDKSFTAIPKEWNTDKERFSSSMRGYKAKNLALHQLHLRIGDILDKMILSGKPFTIERFKLEIRKKTLSGGLFGFLDQLIQEMSDSGKEGNKNVYLDTKRALLKFVSSRSIELEDVTYEFLKRFETSLRAKGCNDGGVSVYMRTLRAILNQAISRSYLDAEFYPFKTSFNKTGGYSISNIKSEYNPRAITSEELERIKSFDLNNFPKFIISYYYFLFSYYSSGMNFKDMALLKWENIHNGRILYNRAKTKGHLSIEITEPISQILMYFRREYESDYIFPILNESKHLTPLQISNRLKKCLKMYNADLKEIKQLLNLTTKLTSYTARHTFAQTLLNKGVRTDIISQKLDHKNITTTKHYLKELGNSELDEVNRHL